jgi:phosphopantetheinyl transferase
MPAHLEITNENAEMLYLWDISEDESVLEAEYCADGSSLPEIRDTGRRVHFLASRLLIRSCFPQYRLEKDAWGKPYLKGFGGHISLSHSGSLAGLLVSPQTPCGLDIELMDERVVRIAPRFCNKDELDFIQEGEKLEALHLIWGAKECMYKAYGRKEIDFRKHMRLAPFSVSDSGMLSGTLALPGGLTQYNIGYKKRGDYLLLWTAVASG